MTACAPRQQEFSAGSATPVIADGQLVATDGELLRLHEWVPQNKVEAVVLALHGFNDYGKAFDPIGSYMMLHNIATYAFDQRGFGHSTQPKIWPGKQNMLRDVADAVQALRILYPDTPLYILGESMGGAVAIEAATHNYLSDIAGIVLVAPAIWGGDSFGALYRLPLWIAAHTLPFKEITGGNLELLPTDNILLLQEMSKDPYVLKSTRLDSIYGLVSLMDNAYRDLNQVPFPTLILYGAKDQIIPKMPFYQNIVATASPHRLAYYPNGYHMLTRDIEAYGVMEDIVTWIYDHHAAFPSGADVSAVEWLEYDTMHEPSR